MIKITIITVGKIKEKYWQTSIDEYIKRLQPYIKVRFIELLEEKIIDIGNKLNILNKEGGKIIKSIPSGSMVISLLKEGTSLSSIELAKQIDKWTESGQELVFVIGGPLGLSDEVLKISNFRISLSKMTFTHQMAKVILIEQIYRAIMIKTGKIYHY